MFTATPYFSKALAIAACLLVLPAGATTVARVADASIERDVGQIAAHLSTLCPKADAASQAAFDACRKGALCLPVLRARVCAAVRRAPAQPLCP